MRCNKIHGTFVPLSLIRKDGRASGNLDDCLQDRLACALPVGQELLEARRQRLIAARDAQELDDTVVRETLEQMDLEQAFMDMNSKRMAARKET